MKILAAVVEVAPTNLSGVMTPAWTPRSHMIAILSSIPLTPLGILVKSLIPMAFCFEVKVQLSVPVHWRSPLARSSIRYLGSKVVTLILPSFR